MRLGITGLGVVGALVLPETAPRPQVRGAISGIKALMRWLLMPTAIYIGLFCLLTYPLILAFPTQFFTNAGDGLQNVWNLWWVNRAVSVEHVSPWFTTYLYYPSGINLIGHTLNPFNGFVSVLLLRFISLIAAHNVIVVFSFVMGGVGACWVSYAFCKHYAASVIGGSVFTFSEYHFAHADGHLQLISLEWLPIFALAWYVLVRKPSYKVSTGCAVGLLLVILCDFYYFVYSILYAAIVAGCEAWRRRDTLFLLRKPYIRPFLMFVLLAMLTSGPLVFELLTLNARDPLLGAHDPASFSTDLLGAIIPGGHWRFAELSRPFWDALPGNIQESSVDIGLAVIAGLLYLVARRANLLVRQAAPWWFVLLAFWLLSLGPVLRVWGTPLPEVSMPYSLLQALIPAINLSGVPARMMVMVTLAAAVLTSVAFALLLRTSRRTRVAAGGLLVLLAIEYLPRPIPTTMPDTPAYVGALERVQHVGGVLDLVSGYWSDRPFGSNSGAGIALYYQTMHEVPMAAGYVARLPSTAWAILQVQRLLADQHDFAALCREYDFHYLVIRQSDAPIGTLAGARLVFADDVADADVYDLAPDGSCIS